MSEDGSRFGRSAALVPDLVVLEHAGSTNEELAILVGRGWDADFTTVVTSDQTDGRGRHDRGWSLPRGRGLAISVLMPVMPLAAAGWLPLIAGLSMRDAATLMLGGRAVALKWPNDVLVGERKLAGVLSRLVSDRVVVGAGINTMMTSADLPVPTATSLLIEGADPEGIEDLILSRYLSRLMELVGRYVNARGDADASRIRDATRDACSTVGRRVRVELPDGAIRYGLALDIATDGRLLVREEASGAVSPIAAGDVVHIRAQV